MKRKDKSPPKSPLKGIYLQDEVSVLYCLKRKKVLTVLHFKFDSNPIKCYKL
jgi:hypothetical protein